MIKNWTIRQLIEWIERGNNYPSSYYESHLPLVILCFKHKIALINNGKIMIDELWKEINTLESSLLDEEKELYKGDK